MEERFRKRLALWKGPPLSKGERLTLVNCTLSSLPIYHIYTISRVVSLRLEKGFFVCL